MSVGHVARLLEQAGIPTVTIASRVFEKPLEKMHLPRVLLTPHIMGRPLGEPRNRREHMQAVKEALLLLKNATQPGTIEHLHIDVSG